jgi:CRP/FNR family transcriptional regulator
MLAGDISSDRLYHKEDYIFRQGERCKKLFIVKSGSIKSFITSDDGNEQVIGFRFAGEVLGLDALDGSEHLSSVIALENSVICGFSRSYIEFLCRTDPSFQGEIIARFSREIVRDYQLLMLINKKTAEQRVAIFLLELLIRMNFVPGQSSCLKLSMSRADIADYLGLVPETVSRILSRFERFGIITVKKKKLQIIDEQSLIHYSSSLSSINPSSIDNEESIENSVLLY